MWDRKRLENWNNGIMEWDAHIFSIVGKKMIGDNGK
jgi:hypothetical protein